MERREAFLRIGAGALGMGALFEAFSPEEARAAGVSDKVILPQWFGAKGDGVNDDTAAIQAAINAAGANSTIYFPAGQYLVTSELSVTNHHVYLVGGGMNVSTLLFAPTANGTCLKIQNSNTAADIVQGGILSLSFFSNDSTYVKTAINIVAVSQYIIRDCFVGGSIVYGGTNVWSDSATQTSIALRTNGHEAVTVDNCQLMADRPIVIGPNPVPVERGIDCDHFNFTDLYLVANQNPCVYVQDNTQLTTVSFLGRQVWGRGTYGFFWNNSTGTASLYQLRFDNVRWEQVQDTTGYAIYIAFLSTGNLRMLTMTNCNFNTEATSNGLYFRNVIAAILTNVFCGANGVALNVDTSCSKFVFWNCYLGSPGSTISLGGFTDFYPPDWHSK